jgi:hypothetical protein
MGGKEVQVMRLQAVLAPLLALDLALISAGCSFVLGRTPDRYEPSKDPKCQGYIVPVIDTLAAIGISIGAGYCFREEKIPTETVTQCVAMGPIPMCWDEKKTHPDPVVTGALLAVAAGALVASAIYGYIQATKCKRAEEAHDLWLESLPSERRLVLEQVQLYKQKQRCLFLFKTRKTNYKWFREQKRCMELLKKDIEKK